MEDDVVEPQADHHEEAQQREAGQRQAQPAQRADRDADGHRERPDIPEDVPAEQDQQQDGQDGQRDPQQPQRRREKPVEDLLDGPPRLEDDHVRIARNEVRPARNDQSPPRAAERVDDPLQPAGFQLLRIQEPLPLRRDRCGLQARHLRVLRPFARMQLRDEGRVLPLPPQRRDDCGEPPQPLRLLALQALLQTAARHARDPRRLGRIQRHEQALAFGQVAVRPIEGRGVGRDLDPEDSRTEEE